MENSNNKIVIASSALLLISERLTANNAPGISVGEIPLPNLDKINIFDTPGSCPGITPPRNRKERRAMKKGKV